LNVPDRPILSGRAATRELAMAASARRGTKHNRTRLGDGSASGDDLPWWEIIRLKSTPAAHVGRVQAADAASAIKVTIEQYQIIDPIQ